MAGRVRGTLSGLRSPSGRAKVRYALSWRLNRALYPSGFALLSDYFYQPLPSRRALREHTRCEVPAVSATLPAQLDHVVTVLERYRGETAGALAAWGYRRADAQLSAGDAELLYAMVRHHRPRRVVEVGSGSSTLVVAAALDRNVAEGGEAEFLSIDPFVVPPLDPGRLPAGLAYRHVQQPLQEVGASLAGTLGSGDLLFVDSSHVFKRGSDVEYQFLHLYPALAGGVLLHVHDVFFPQDYPLEWNLRRAQFWNEQHVLAAVLQNSSRYEVLACLSAVHAADPGVLRRLVDDFPPAGRPGSIWLRVGPDGAGAS